MNSTSGRFAVPRQRRSMVPRLRLTRKLHAAIGAGLTVVQAPVGFGKSALLASFVAELQDDYDVRWLALDGSSASPEVFAEQLGQAIAEHHGFHPPVTAEKLDDLRAYLGGLLSRAGEASERPLLLILDNVHELAPSDSACELLGWLLDALSDGQELFLSGRSLPRVREVESRVATGDCVLIESSDLAFTLEEIAVLLPEGSPLDAHDLMAATDGWPAAVMATIAGGMSIPGAALSRTSAAWEQYLAAEVWASVPTELHPHLLRIALPPACGPELGQLLVGDEGWRELLSWLTLNDFLYEPLGNDTVRLNPLLRTFLRAEFRRSEPAGIEPAVREVVLYLEDAGQVSDAIEAARDWEAVDILVELAERHTRGLLHQGAFSLLARLFEAIPAQAFASRSVLSALHARVLAHNNRPAEALAAAEEVIDTPGALREARLHALLAKYRALRLMGQPDQLPGIFEHARDVGATLDASLTAELRFNEAHLVLALHSDFDRASELLHEAMEYCRLSQLTTLELLAQSTLGQLLAMRGDGPAAVAELSRAAQGWRALGGSSNLGWVLNNLGMAHLTVGDFESAAVALEEARLEGKRTENPRNLAYATASLADAEIARGQFDKARVHYEEAIRICSEEAPDETLACLSIAGLAAALLGLGKVREADFFSQRALYIAETLGNPYELGICLLQHAAIASAAQDHVTAISSATRARELFASINGEAPLRVAHYRLAAVQFRANRRADAQATLQALPALIPEPWMLGALLPVVREQPMFAQWVASRSLLGPAFRTLLEQNTFGAIETEEPEPQGKRPRVVARSLGDLQVAVGGRDVPDEAWASARAKELFFLFLANPHGLRKEDAVERLYPEIEAEKCNSAFHSNLYRVRRALYAESIVKQNGSYVLDPEGSFEWDVEQFEAALDAAAALPPGSDERAAKYREALTYYRGPFAETFYSEWAETLRQRIDERAQEALSVLAGYHAGQGDFTAAAQAMEQVLRRNRFNEEAAFNLARFRARAGAPAAALAFLDEFGRTYHEEFGEGPPTRFGKLRREIAAGMAV